MKFSTITVEINGPLGRLTLNRPERLNAMNATMLLVVLNSLRLLAYGKVKQSALLKYGGKLVREARHRTRHFAEDYLPASGR